MGKKRRVWWIVGGLVVVLMSFSWAAFAFGQDDGDVMAEVSAILEQRGFEPEGSGAIIDADNDLDKAARFVGPHLSEPQCRALMKDLEVTGWTWNVVSSSWGGTGPSGTTGSDWRVNGNGRRGSFSTDISIGSGATGSNDHATRIQVTVHRLTLLDLLGLNLQA